MRTLHKVLRTSKVPVLIVVIISLGILGVPMKIMTSIPQPLMSPPRISSTPLRLAPLASAAPYDEQVGITFTQDFSRLAFNVTAVDFTDKLVGPGYLVNGLTDRGYWYQVGLSYNWPMTDGSVNQGFSMNYEVFDPSQNSIYPASGGGIQGFNGTVNIGDSVLLSLSFSRGFVFMNAMDWQTRSSAAQSFPAYASRNIFIGLPSSLEQNHFFSGLMTEQYHYFPYEGTGSPVTYSTSGPGISSTWMWMDEWNTNTGQPVFGANTASPVPLSQSIGQYFSSNGTAEIATIHRVVTGLTPVIFPSLIPDSQTTGQPGHQANINLVIDDQDGATVEFDNITISTSFGRYNFTSGMAFSFGPGMGHYNIVLMLPPNLPPRTYNLTISVTSWRYMDVQAQTWLPLRSASVNQTLLVSNSPPPANPPNTPGLSPPSSGQGPSSSTNRTTFSPASLLKLLRSQVIPLLATYAVLGLLAVALMIRQEWRKSFRGPSLGLRFCTNCGRQLDLYTMNCPTCNSSTSNVSSSNQSSMQLDQGRTQSGSGAQLG